jgi:hypothetical protein
MNSKLKILGAFALILCLSVAIFSVVSDDTSADASKEASDFADKFNEYSKGVLGDNLTVIKATASGTTVTVNVDTTKSTLEENLKVDFYEIYKKQTEIFENYNITIKNVKGSDWSPSKIIDDGELDLGVALNYLAATLKIIESGSSSTATVESDLSINGADVSLSVAIKVDSSLRTAL